jgi:hypothetical protein
MALPGRSSRYAPTRWRWCSKWCSRAFEPAEHHWQDTDPGRSIRRFKSGGIRSMEHKVFKEFALALVA